MKTATPILLILTFFAIVSFAEVPKKQQFKYVNEGEFGPYINEYDASYRLTDIFASPFQLGWYNTTPGEYYLALRLGTQYGEPLYRWVWEANRGHPVGEGATLSFLQNGNLVLAEANGDVVWSTGTADGGAVGLRLLPNGNIVIYDKKGNFLWQSFDHPTDTLLIGQTLYAPNKLVSRKSLSENVDGLYSLVIDKTGFNLYITPSPEHQPLRYTDDRFSDNNITKVTFHAEVTNDGAAYELLLNSAVATRVNYNATISFLRLEIDGNLAIYTYYTEVDYAPTARTFLYFDDDDRFLTSCALPSKCGALGLCEDGMCVACPTATKGLLGWNRQSCKPPALAGACNGRYSLRYRKVVGVEHYIPRSNKGVGKAKLDNCRRKCNKDCSCLGFFYHEESSKCWLAPTLGALEITTNTSHVLYLKYY